MSKNDPFLSKFHKKMFFLELPKKIHFILEFFVTQSVDVNKVTNKGRNY